MKSAPKPIMTCTADVRLLEAFDPSSQELQKVKLGDVFELLEGPRELSLATEMHIKGNAAKDNSTGWILLSDSSGNSFASSATNFYKCVSATALTDSADIQKCKPLRKVDVGE